MELAFQPAGGISTSSFEISSSEFNDQDTKMAIAAIVENDESTAMRCISNIAATDAEQPARLRYCLHQAVKNTRLSIIRAILSYDATIINEDVLVIAIESRSTAMLSLFVEMGWDINEALGPWDPPPLALAVHDRDMVRWFLQNGADPDARCNLDLTPLSVAVEVGHFEVVKLMMGESRRIRSGQLLHHAVRREAPDCAQVIEYILGQGADVNEVMYQHEIKSYLQLEAFGLGTPLHEAAKLGKLDVIELLGRYSANPLIEDSLGMMPIQVAEAMNHSDACGLLQKLAERAKPPELQFTATVKQLYRPDV
ncbi:hypothetical protein KC343_g9754 [Hortaea werneckii]|uniref:Uncharacterized protein n=1 Tax=Hortaea werneckii TaxID=91943 RepID=A0A3M7H693_HORWE|nr:hypothetical protein KC323_g5570 [Hortaea werneckii]KAI7205814.1 hypothetical protein KC352_g18251 [Hortaea werneckii]KAI7344416.1 hypothetical protein KC320_g8849 [Hortaea werneckii]KAI7560074.1 hypothetical protein KC317_g9957 [Hortaea werneckii]KAI7608488.1 hypothetical protein KC346_g9576 [Hortaea werneckii]